MLTIISLLATFCFIGGIAFLIDDRLGTSIIASIRKMGKKPSLPVGTKCGAIGGRSFQARFWWAVCLGAVTSYFLCGWFSSSLAGNAGAYMMSVIGILLGFFAGPAFVWVWIRRNNFFKKIDQIEKKEIDLGTEVKAAASGLAQNATAAVTGIGHNLAEQFTNAAEEFTKHLPRHAEEETPEPETAPIALASETAINAIATETGKIPDQKDELTKAREAVAQYTDGKSSI